jgi:hypothetical protein
MQIPCRSRLAREGGGFVTPFPRASPLLPG